MSIDILSIKSVNSFHRALYRLFCVSCNCVILMFCTVSVLCLVMHVC